MAISRIGFGQVEPNHLSAQRTAQIYAQLPAKSTMTVLENGQFVKYDYANNEVNTTGAGEWMMVFNEVKLYDDKWREQYKDYAMQKVNCVDGVMVPRVIKTNVGDIYTTNCLKAAAASKDATVAMDTYAVGNKLVPDTTGYLKIDNTATTGMIWQVVAVTTMADAQDAVKLMRIN